jgi:hypothetical protein
LIFTNPVVHHPIWAVHYSVYVAAIGKASHLHAQARQEFSKLYAFDFNEISPEELMEVMARPYQEGSRNVSALV